MTVDHKVLLPPSSSRCWYDIVYRCDASDAAQCFVSSPHEGFEHLKPSQSIGSHLLHEHEEHTNNAKAESNVGS